MGFSFLNRRKIDNSKRWIVFLLFPMAVCFLTLLSMKIQGSVFDDRNWERLTATFALAHGFPVYHALDSGPVLNTIYGPVSMLIYLPSTIASSPTLAMHLAEVILIACFFLPPLWLHLKAPQEEKNKGREYWFYRLFVFLIFCYFPFIAKPLRDGAFNLHVDGPTLGLAAMACAFLYFRTKQNQEAALSFSALFTVLSVWSKQVTVPLLAALPLYLFFSDGQKLTLRYLFDMLFHGVLISAILLIAFDPSRILFNILVIPARHGLNGGALALVTSTFKLLGEIAVVLIVLAVSLISYFQRHPMNFTNWIRSWRGSVFLIVGLLMIPTSVLSNAKVGGSTNTFSYPGYFLLLAATLGFLDLSTNRGIRYFLIGLSVLFLCIEIPRSAYYLARLPRQFNYADMVFAYIKKHPGEAYFPRLTLLHLMAENKIYHASGGLKDRAWAGLPVSEEHLRTFLPGPMKIMAFRTKSDNDKSYLPLPEYSSFYTLDPELPGFRIYKKKKSVENK